MRQMIQKVKKSLMLSGNAYVTEEVKNITPADIFASINYFFNLLHQVGRHR